MDNKEEVKALLKFILKGYTKSKVFLIHVEVFLIKNKKDI